MASRDLERVRHVAAEAVFGDRGGVGVEGDLVGGGEEVEGFGDHGLEGPQGEQDAVQEGPGGGDDGDGDDGPAERVEHAVFGGSAGTPTALRGVGKGPPVSSLARGYDIVHSFELLASLAHAFSRLIIQA